MGPAVPRGRVPVRLVLLQGEAVVAASHVEETVDKPHPVARRAPALVARVRVPGEGVTDPGRREGRESGVWPGEKRSARSVAKALVGCFPLVA